MLPESELARIRRATGLDMDAERVAAICALQNAEQTEQFAHDMATAVWADDRRIAGRATDEDAEMYNQACKRIAWWYVMEDMMNASRKWPWLTNRFLRRLILGRQDSVLVSDTMHRMLSSYRDG